MRELRVSERCAEAQKARLLLQEAHDACFKSKDRDILGMSSGPFSGVNQVLELIAEMAEQISEKDATITTLRQELMKR